MSDMHGNTLLLEKAAITHAAHKLTKELEGGYSIRTKRCVSFFIAQLLNSAQSMRYASENMPMAMAETSPSVSEKTISEIVRQACKFREEVTKTENEARSEDVLQELKRSLSQLD